MCGQSRQDDGSHRRRLDRWENAPIREWQLHPQTSQISSTAASELEVAEHTHTHTFNGHFPSKSGLASCPLDSQCPLQSSFV